MQDKAWAAMAADEHVLACGTESVHTVRSGVEAGIPRLLSKRVWRSIQDACVVVMEVKGYGASVGGRDVTQNAGAQGSLPTLKRVQQSSTAQRKMERSSEIPCQSVDSLLD